MRVRDTERQIVLMGFKQVGKTTVGRALATTLPRRFVDLDAEVERHYATHHGFGSTCREIVAKHGLDFFAQLESARLTTILGNAPGVIALGGATPLWPQSRDVLAGHHLIHLIAPADDVFARIISRGWPSSFPQGEDQRRAFDELWLARKPIYESLATVTSHNDGNIPAVVSHIRHALGIDP